MIEWTCCQCGNKYTDQTGDTGERMCDECLNHEDASDFLTQRDNCLDHEDEFDKKEDIPIGAQPYPHWDDKKKEYIYKKKEN